MKKIRSIITLMVILIPFVTFAQYNIKLKVKGVKDTVVYMGNYFGNKRYAIDTAKINSKGIAVFKGDKKLDGGMYMMLFPSRGMTYFEFIMPDDQNFSLETDTNGFYLENMKIKGSTDNTEFFTFQKKLNEIGKQLHDGSEEYKKAKEKNETAKMDSLRNALNKLSDEREAFLEKTANTTKSKTLRTIVNLMRDVKVPDNLKVPDNVANKDSMLKVLKYYYYKNHYWDYVDLSDSTILRTPMFEPKLKQYMTKTLVQHPDTIIKEGEKLIAKAEKSPQVFRYLVVYMLDYNNESKLMGMDKVFVEIANKYYLTGKATWADSSLVAKVKERAEKMAPNLVGNQAPDLQRLESWDHKYYSLYDLDNDYIVLIFWEPHCGHCKKEVPKLHKVYQELKKEGVDIEVMAIYTQVDRKPWEEFIKEKEIGDWINVYDKYQFTNFRNLYDVYATPTIYVLDKDKKIIAKRIVSEQIKNLIEKLEGLKK